MYAVLVVIVTYPCVLVLCVMFTFRRTIVLVSDHLGLISESESVLDSTLHIS